MAINRVFHNGIYAVDVLHLQQENQDLYVTMSPSKISKRSQRN